ncbi:MAG: L-histidine N(alpha)-methyltransferase [Arenimonas sp.]|nr:L-histidine N(alpha)-methyltransferase [Arenimonas sp.]
MAVLRTAPGQGPAMTVTAPDTVELTDLHPSRDDLLGDVLAGLSASPKRLPSKYFYDRRGSELFEEITRQPEYYLTRTELALIEDCAPRVAAAVGPRAHVVEYGSGSGRKTRLLLDALEDPVAYTPVEISRSALVGSVQRLDEEFGPVQMLPVLGDFTQRIPLPEPGREARRVLVFFPGSTLGNLTDAESVRLLKAMRETMGDNGAALIGIDLQKSPALIEAAYNDAAGVTAAFTLNLLVRLNRELGADFDLDGFRHRAVYVPEAGRIETFIDSQRAQTVTVQGRAFAFAAGEAMQVEYSHKYTDEGFAALAARAGLQVVQGWNDPRDWFGLRLLQPA